MYFLHRDPAAAALVVRPTVDAGRLLGSRFLSYLDEPEQLARHLDTAASIAGKVEMFEVAIPKSSSAVALAAHMGSG